MRECHSAARIRQGVDAARYVTGEVIRPGRVNLADAGISTDIHTFHWNEFASARVQESMQVLVILLVVGGGTADALGRR